MFRDTVFVDDVNGGDELHQHHVICQMQVCFVARLSQRECVGNVVKCA